MHELSIAGAMLEAALHLVPAGARLTAVQVRAGAMRGIEPEAMQWAWQAATADTPWAEVKLGLEVLPWRLHCPDCGCEFAAEDVLATCACGGQAAHPVGGDELQIVSIEVDEASDDPARAAKQGATKQKETGHEGRGRRKRSQAQ